jgi:hypothetical protein
MMLGYNVIMPSDANATLTDEEHAAALNTFSVFFGDVMATKEVIARVGGSSQPRSAKSNVLQTGRRIRARDLDPVAAACRHQTRPK